MIITRVLRRRVRPTAAAHTAGAIIISAAQSASGDIILLWLFHFIRYGREIRPIRIIIVISIIIIISTLYKVPDRRRRHLWRAHRHGTHKTIVHHITVHYVYYSYIE